MAIAKMALLLKSMRCIGLRVIFTKVKIAHYSIRRAKILKSTGKGHAQKLQNFYKTLYSREHDLEGETLDNVQLLDIINEIIHNGHDKNDAIDKPIFKVVSDLIKREDISEQGLKTLDPTTMKKIKENLIDW
jgi:hypothetical protein